MMAVERFLSEKGLKGLIKKGRVPLASTDLPDGRGFVIVPPVGANPNTRLQEIRVVRSVPMALFRTGDTDKAVEVVNVPAGIAKKIKEKVLNLL